MKKILCIVLPIVLVLAAAPLVFKAACDARIKKVESTVYPIPENYRKLEKTEICIDYVFDPSDKEKAVGCCDYVFVAEVESVPGTSYEDADFFRGRLRGSPYTEFKLEVKKNIKGKLKTDKAVSARVFGGVELDKKHYIWTASSPFLPQAGQTYIVLANEGEDGELFINDMVFAGGKGAQLKTLTKAYEEAFENQDTTFAAGKRYPTPYEVK